MIESANYIEPKEEKKENINPIEKTILKWGQYVNPEKPKQKLNSGQLLEKASNWKITTYQSFLQCLAWLIAHSETNKDVLEMTNSLETWKLILGDKYNEEWQHAIIGINQMYSKNLERIADKFGEERVNDIEKWRLLPALKTVYDYISNEENPTTENSLKVLEAAILPHYFKIPNDIIIDFINRNIDNKNNGNDLILPPQVIRVMETTRNKVFHNAEL